jgi:LmbE family N-acetylglucosaminyl deacetylase
MSDKPVYAMAIAPHPLLMLKYHPQIVIINDPYYRFRGYFTSIDHRIAGQAAMDAVWPYLLVPGTYRDLIDTGYRPHKVQEVLMWQTDNVNFHIDITDTFDLKVAALSCHKNQTASQPEGWEERFKERCPGGS